MGCCQTRAALFGVPSLRVLASPQPCVGMASSAPAGAAEPAKAAAALPKAPHQPGEQSKLLPNASGSGELEQSGWPSLKEAGALLAAIVVGASSPITRPGMVKLNARSDSPWHAVHVSVIVMGLGLAWLAVAALVSERRKVCTRAPPPDSPSAQPRRAPRWWTFLGGFATAPAVASIPASLALGVQGAMLAMMAGQTLCALALDVWFERSVRLGPWLIVGIVVVMAGIAVDVG